MPVHVEENKLNNLKVAQHRQPLAEEILTQEATLEDDGMEQSHWIPGY